MLAVVLIGFTVPNPGRLVMVLSSLIAIGGLPDALSRGVQRLLRQRHPKEVCSGVVVVLRIVMVHLLLSTWGMYQEQGRNWKLYKRS